ncbi:MAG: TolC family outer membrane protein [Parvularculales bacterium]
MKKNSGVALRVFCGLVGVMIAFPAQADTLEEALSAAYTSNPVLLAELAAARAADKGVSVAYAGFHPEIRSSGTYAWQQNAIKRTVGTSAYQTTNTTPLGVTGSVSQNLFSGFRTINEVKQAKSLARAGLANLLNVEQQVMLDAVTAYFDVYQNEAEVRLNQGQVEVLTRQLKAAQDRFEVGEDTNTGVAQSNARLAFAKSSLIRAEASLVSARAAYERAIGQAPGTLELGTLPDIPATIEDVHKIALGNNPALQTAQHVERASDIGISMARGALLPTLDVTARTSHAWDRTDFTERNIDNTLTVELSVPLYNGIVYPGIGQLSQQNAQDRLMVAAAGRQVIEGVQGAWVGLKSAEAQIASDREQVTANEIALEGVRQEAQVGSQTTLDVLNAAQDLLNARVSLTRAERNRYVAYYSLLSVMGVLTARDLELPVEYHDSADY